MRETLGEQKEDGHIRLGLFCTRREITTTSVLGTRIPATAISQVLVILPTRRLHALDPPSVTSRSTKITSVAVSTVHCIIDCFAPIVSQMQN